MTLTTRRIALCPVITAVVLLPARLSGAREARQLPARDLVVNDPPVLKDQDGKVEARIYLDAASVGVTEASLTRLDVAPGTAIEMHVHPDATEVLYILSGEGDLARSKTKTRLAPGKAVLIPAGAVHGFTAGSAPVQIVQFFLPGGPEQRLRDATRPGTVAPDKVPPASHKDSADIELLDGTTAPTRHVGKKTYCYLAEERPAGEQSCDLMKVDRPGNQAADTHPHDDVSELIYIVSGDGEVTIDGRSWKVKGGSAYYTPLGSEMGLATTTETESVVLVVNR